MKRIEHGNGEVKKVKSAVVIGDDEEDLTE
jgi:hypothetical protein